MVNSSSRPILSSIHPELQDDGSYLILFQPENQKKFMQTNNSLNFTLHAIKDVLDLQMYGAFLTFKSRGNDYLHTHHSWYGGGSATLMLGRWDVSYEFCTAPKILAGETITRGENQSNLEASYKYKGLEVGLGVLLLGYPQGFEYYNESLSKYYRNVGHTYIKNNGNMIFINLSYKFNHGRKYNAGTRKLNNSDSDNGIM